MSIVVAEPTVTLIAVLHPGLAAIHHNLLHMATDPFHIAGAMATVVLAFAIIRARRRRKSGDIPAR